MPTWNAQSPISAPRRLFCALLCLVAALWFPAEAFPQVQGNGEVLAQTLARATSSQLVSLRDRPIRLFYEAPPFVLASIRRQLIADGYRVVETEGEEAVLVRLEPIVDLKFRRTSKRQGERLLSGNLSVSAIAADGSVLYAGVEPLAYSDVTGADPTALYDGQWASAAFSSVTMNRRGSKFRRIAEPALIVAAVTVTVYLLFNVRSQ